MDETDNQQIQINFVNKKLVEAVRESNLGKVDACLAKGADIDARTEKGNTALAVAIFDLPGNENPTFAEELIKRGADIFAKQANGKTVLDWVYTDTSFRTEDARRKMTDMLLQNLPDARQNKGLMADFDEAASQEAIKVGKPMHLVPPARKP